MPAVEQTQGMPITFRRGLAKTHRDVPRFAPHRQLSQPEVAQAGPDSRLVTRGSAGSAGGSVFVDNEAAWPDLALLGIGRSGLG
jgi:hypothetical protein